MEDSTSAKVDGGPTRLTSLGMIAEPPALPCRDDALVNKGAEAPKPCLSPMEVRTPTAAGSLLPAGTVSTAMKTIFPPPPLWDFCPTEERNFTRTYAIQTYTTYNSFWKIKVLETKSRQTLVFDPGGCTQVIYAPARFWEGGARCFMEGFSFECSKDIRGWSVFGNRTI